MQASKTLNHVATAPTGAATVSPASLSVTFVSQAALGAGIARKLGSRRHFAAVSGTRSVRRPDLVAGLAVPQIEVDPADGTVSPDGRVLTARPISQVPLPLPARLSSRCHRYDRRMPRSGLGCHHLRSRARG